MCILPLLVAISLIFSICDEKNGKSCLNTEKDYFDQPTACKPPIRWLKYTTLNPREILSLLPVTRMFWKLAKNIPRKLFHLLNKQKPKNYLTWCPPWSPSCQSADGDGGLLWLWLLLLLLTVLSNEMLLGMVPVAEDLDFSPTGPSWDIDFCGQG